eukprot:gene6983-7768_t
MAEGPKKIHEHVKHFIAGGGGGMSLVFAGHPLDTIKVRLQTQPIPTAGQAPQFNGLFDCAKKTIRNEGVRGLYKGMGTPLLVATPMCAVGFWGFGLGKSLQTNATSTQLSHFQLFKAGMLSGLFVAFLNAPGERIKCLLQVQLNDGVKAKYKGPFDCAKQLYNEKGIIRGLYRGIGFTIMRDVPGTATFFTTYETLQGFLTKEDNRLSPSMIILAGGTAGVLANIIVLPFDVVKSRYQIAPEGVYENGLLDVVRVTLRTEGLGAFFKGAAPMMIRAFPANAACFLGFEFSRKRLKKMAATAVVEIEESRVTKNRSFVCAAKVL